MRYVLITVGGIVGLVVLALLGLIINMRLATARERKRTLAKLAPVLEPLAAGRVPDPAAVQQLCADLSTRSSLFDVLCTIGKTGLMPAEFRTPQALAESEMARWLSHPNELAATPDEIRLVQMVPVQTNIGEVQYFLFRFRTNPPHWAADKGWMAGVAGPYRAGELCGQAGGTFSELEPIDTRAPVEHVQFLHGKTFETMGKDAIAARASK